MVGGTVIGVARGAEGVSLLNVKDSHYADTCAVRCKDDGKINGKINVGDSVWWQCGKVYWTPKGATGKRCHVDYDVEMEKVGYSH